MRSRWRSFWQPLSAAWDRKACPAISRPDHLILCSVLWSTLQNHGVAAFDVILWNIFPWHPHKAGNLLTNRTPSTPELDVGVEFAKMLLELVPGMQIVAIGQKAADTLSRYGIGCTAVRHPSMGGAETFRAQVAELFQGSQD